jgi:hypothetical protein
VRNRILFGRTFTSSPLEVMLDDLERSVSSWRKKIGPNFSEAYERLVAAAIADGTEGRDGVRPEFNAFSWEDYAGA